MLSFSVFILYLLWQSRLLYAFFEKLLLCDGKLDFVEKPTERKRLFG